MSGGAMEEAVLTTPGGGGVNNYCIWCLSNYGDNDDPHPGGRKRKEQRSKAKKGVGPNAEVKPDPDPNVSDGDIDKSQRFQSYKERRHKLVLEYILQCDPIQESEDQRRRHLLVKKLLESCKTEEVRARGAEAGALYQLCPSCDDKADEVMKLHLALEAVQAKLLDRVSSLIDIIINNSMYGSNEETKRRMQELEIRLQQRHEEGGGLEGRSGETEVFKNYMDILQQFQTLIFEGGGKLRNVPRTGLQMRMPISKFSEKENNSRSVIDSSILSDFIGDENIESCLNTPASPSSSRIIINKKKFPKTSLKSKSRQNRPTFAKSKMVTVTDTDEQQLQDQELLIANVTQELPVYWDNLENEVKEEPIDDVPPSTPLSQLFQFPEDFEGPLPLSSQELPQSQGNDHEPIVPDQDSSGSEKRRRLKPSRFSSDNSGIPIQQQPKPSRIKNKTSQLKKDHRLIKVTGAPKQLIKMIRPNRSKVIERQKKLIKDGKKRKKKRCEFSCSACSFVGTTTYEFVHHLREHETSEKVFECKETDCEERRFSEKQFYDFHTRLHKNIVGFSKCGICDLRFSPPALKPHMKSHQTKVFPCSNCYFCTDNIKDFVYHLRHHRRYKTFDQLSCPLCPKLFQKQREVTSALVNHLYSDHGCNELLLKCEFKDCSETFLGKTALTNHYNIHLKRFKCSSCKESFKCNFTLREHVQNVHLQLGLFSCNVGGCLENFKNKFQLESHQVTCHDFPKFKCELCIECEYNNSAALRGHVARVHNTNSYVCVACGKNCSTIQALRRHETIHLEKNVSCDECDFVTKSRHQLRKHKSTIHRTAPMKHGCPHCPKRFNWKRAMDDHIRTHTGEKPFVCEFCSAAFSKKQPMTNHIKKVHAAHEVGPSTSDVAVTATTSEKLVSTSSTIYVSLL